MPETFSLTISHNGTQHILEGELRTVGYTHKIFIQVGDVEVVFEPDEERNFRAIVYGDRPVDQILLQKIAGELENALK